MKDFLILCAKIALGLIIGFTLIYGSSGSLKQRAENVNKGATDQFDNIVFDSIPNTKGTTTTN